MLYERAPDGFKKEFDVVGCYVLFRGRFLMLFRHPHGTDGGTWGLPAGKVEQNETLIKGMTRELFEETGIMMDSAKLHLLKTVYLQHNRQDIEYHMYQCIFDHEPNITLNLTEHVSYRWVTPAEALELPLIEDQGECIRLCEDLGNLFPELK